MICHQSTTQSANGTPGHHGSILHEEFGYASTVYVKEMGRSDGSYKHGKTNVILTGNMYGSKSAGHYFIKGMNHVL